jgi:hypothetical protein
MQRGARQTQKYDDPNHYNAGSPDSSDMALCAAAGPVAIPEPPK